MSGCLVRSLGEPTRFPLEHTASQRPAGGRAQGGRGAGSPLAVPPHSPTPPGSWPLRQSELLE